MHAILGIVLCVLLHVHIARCAAPPGSGWSALVLSCRLGGCGGSQDHRDAGGDKGSVDNASRGGDEWGLVFAVEDQDQGMNPGDGSAPPIASHRFLRVGASAFVLCSGLQSDVLALEEELQRQILDAQHISLDSIGVTKLISNILYNNRLHVAPIVAGLVENGPPFIASMDSRGALVQSSRYAATGAVKEPLMNMCETLYRPEMGPEEVAELARKCLEGALARDVGSSGGSGSAGQQQQGRMARVFALQRGVLWAKNKNR